MTDNRGASALSKHSSLLDSELVVKKNGKLDSGKAATNGGTNMETKLDKKTIHNALKIAGGVAVAGLSWAPSIFVQRKRRLKAVGIAAVATAGANPKKRDVNKTVANALRIAGGVAVAGISWTPMRESHSAAGSTGGPAVAVTPDIYSTGRSPSPMTPDRYSTGRSPSVFTPDHFSTGNSPIPMTPGLASLAGLMLLEDTRPETVFSVPSRRSGTPSRPNTVSDAPFWVGYQTPDGEPPESPPRQPSPKVAWSEPAPEPESKPEEPKVEEEANASAPSSDRPPEPDSESKPEPQPPAKRKPRARLSLMERIAAKARMARRR